MDSAGAVAANLNMNEPDNVGLFPYITPALKSVHWRVREPILTPKMRWE
jgi:hypothetical protein